MRKRRQIIFGLVLALIALIGGQTIFATPVFAVTDATISISINRSLSLSLMPGTFGSTSQSISVTTTNYTGYTVQLTNSNSSTDLVNGSNSNYTIPTITLPQGSNSITRSQFTSGYGLSTDGTNYVPGPTSSSNISLGNRNSAGTSSHSLYFGVLPAVNTMAGTYTKSYTIIAIANDPQYSITYNANAGNDTVTNMPSNVSATTSSTGTATISSTVPTRSGYTFLGWDTSSSATTPTYATGNTNTITLGPTQANAITLYAVWGPSTRIIHDTTTTVYSPSAVPAGYTVYFDNPNIEGNPIVTADDNGKIVSFEYTNISTNGISFTTGHTLNTGIIAFDDTGFTIHLKIKMNPKNNSGKMLVSAFQQNSGSSNYAGFTFYCYSQQYFYLNASTSSSITGTSFGTHIKNDGWRVQNQENTFTLDLTYTPAPNKSISATFTPVRSGSSSFSSNDTNLMAYIPNSLENATIILSGTGIDSSKDLSNAVIYEFSVTKP